MDETEQTNREQKLAARDKARRHSASSRAYIHAMTNSRVKRQEEAIEKDDKRGQDATSKGPRH